MCLLPCCQWNVDVERYSDVCRVRSVSALDFFSLSHVVLSMRNGLLNRIQLCAVCRAVRQM